MKIYIRLLLDLFSEPYLARRFYTFFALRRPYFITTTTKNKFRLTTKQDTYTATGQP